MSGGFGTGGGGGNGFNNRGYGGGNNVGVSRSGSALGAIGSGLPRYVD